MGCEKLVVLILVCLVNEMASEPRFRLGGLSWGRRRRYCHKTNCVLGSWSSWSACSRSCGPHGTQYSHRPIIKPAKCGGTCSVTTQARACNRFCLNGGTLIRSSCHCKYGYSGVCCEKGHGKDGGWSSWSRWGQCSSSCGTGLQTRKRFCTNPPPGYGGKKCVGTAEQHKNCLLKKCPGKDGGWSSWSGWGQCTGSCGTGLQTRKRFCTNPPPGYGGKKCVGPAEQHKNCLLHRCPVNGGWSDWGAWGKCSKTCGVGYQQSKRYCNNPRPEYGGKKCTGDKIKTRDCSVKSCAVNGGWSTWGPWSECSKTCGYGSQYSKRYCNNPSPGYGGKPCTGKDTRTRGCSIKSCPVNGGWSSWGKWCACSKPCGTGSQYRTRTCTRPFPSNGGKQCTGKDKETRHCNTHHCPVDGGWSNWGNWGACTRTCGNGKQYSKRYCDNPAPKYGGKKCHGTNVKTRECNVKPCPVNGRWSLWGTWSACTKTCGTGSKVRHRTCTNPPPKHGGVCTGPSVQTKTCGEQNCPVNGGWGTWGKWGACSKACGTGKQYRSRYCNKPTPAYGGKRCSGKDKESRNCNTNPCPVNGRWSPWGEWCKCSKTCGTGIQTRKRTCSNPPPQHAGKPCKGISEQTKSCQIKQCPGYGGWGSWGQWSACTKTCGTGTQNRKRTCLGSGNGNCAGSNEESRQCNTQSCPAVDGGWGDWTAWSACSESCGPGTSIRSRQCDNPPPGPGGKQCAGLPVGNRLCNDGACPSGDCWGDWSDWSTCTKACDCGKAYRVRFCKCAHGQGHEKCQGPGESSQSCNCNPCPNGPPSDDFVEG